MAPLLELHGVSKSFGGLHGVSKSFGGLRVIQDLDLVVEEGEIVSLIGPNGAGKTTVFNLVTGVYEPDEGTIRLAGEDAAREVPTARRQPPSVPLASGRDVVAAGVGAPVECGGEPVDHVVARGRPATFREELPASNGGASE